MRPREYELEQPPPVVTGALSPEAKLVYSGAQRGIRYEVYRDPVQARRRSPSGTTITARGWRPGLQYTAVVYTPYQSEDGTSGVEAEQLGFGHDIDEARRIASDYIERVWRQQQPGYRPRTRRR